MSKLEERSRFGVTGGKWSYLYIIFVNQSVVMMIFKFVAIQIAFQVVHLSHFRLPDYVLRDSFTYKVHIEAIHFTYSTFGRRASGQVTYYRYNMSRDS